MTIRHVISKPLIPTSKCFVIKKNIEPYFDPTLHSHAEFQLSYVMKGSGNRFVGNSLNPFSDGDMVLIGPHLPHVWKSHDSYFEHKIPNATTVIVIYFNKEILGESVYLKQEFQKIKILFDMSNQGLHIVDKTRDEVGNLLEKLLVTDGVDSVILFLKILDKIANSSDLHFLNDLEAIAFKESEANRIHEVYDYVMKNFNSKIRLEEVADIANMTQTSFSRYFKTRMNTSFSDFVKEVRISFACKRLEDESHSIESISYESGFPSLTNFNKQFKQITGKTPKEYREEYFRILNTK